VDDASWSLSAPILHVECNRHVAVDRELELCLFKAHAELVVSLVKPYVHDVNGPDSHARPWLRPGLCDRRVKPTRHLQ
jgi:hypothetical protein